MASLFILGAVVWAIILIVVAVVTMRQKRDKSLERIEKAIMKSKDDPIEPARFVP